MQWFIDSASDRLRVTAPREQLPAIANVPVTQIMVVSFS